MLTAFWFYSQPSAGIPVGTDFVLGRICALAHLVRYLLPVAPDPVSITCYYIDIYNIILCGYALFSPKFAFGFSLACNTFFFFFFFTRTSAFSVLPKILGMTLLNLASHFPSSLFIGKLLYGA